MKERREETEAKRGGERNGRNRTAREELFCSSRKQESTWPSKKGQATWRKKGELRHQHPVVVGVMRRRKTRCAEVGEGLTGDLGGGAFGSARGA